MTVAYIVILVLALLPQIAFSILYWKWIPAWIRNPYGRLAQLDSWSQILLLVILLVYVVIGQGLTIDTKRFIFALCLLPVVFLGVFRLTLLKKAVDSAKKEGEDEK